MLPPADTEFLRDRGIEYRAQVDANMLCVVFPNYALPAGLDHSHATLLIRLNQGYPDVAPDMWWFSPGLRRADGTIIAATQANETHLGCVWQRWSRHLNPGQWKSGIDGLESFLALIHQDLTHHARAAA